MSRNNNLHSEDLPDLLDENLSRLVKLVKNTSTPSKSFTESLTDNAIVELKRLEAEGKCQRIRVKSAIGWLKKTIGWAAMVLAACGTGVVTMISVFLQLNSILTAATSVTMFIKWLNYLGGLIS